MHEVAWHGNIEVAKLLIEHGANVNVRDKNGLTLLLLAWIYNHPEITELLIDNGAEIDTQIDADKPLFVAAIQRRKAIYDETERSAFQRYIDGLRLQTT